VQRTTISMILKLSAISFVFAFGMAKFFATYSDALLPINAGSPISLLILDLAMLIWILTILKRLPKVNKSGNEVIVEASKNPLPPLVAARTVAFALSGSRVGSLIFGGYLGLAVSAFTKHHILAYEQNAKFAFASALLGFVMIVLSIWLERKCSPPKPVSE